MLLTPDSSGSSTKKKQKGQCPERLEMMSTHPNVLLISILTPDDLARKTMRDILSHNNVEYDTLDDDVEIGDEKYHQHIMEDNYYEPYQIEGKEGDLIFFDLVTYGYGEWISWVELEKQKLELEKWSREMCEKFKCSYEIRVSANYW